MPRRSVPQRYFRLIAIIAILISVFTWAMDLTGLVYECPYCRVQRSTIGLIGLLMLLPNPQHWLARWLASVFGVLGLTVASSQHFAGWKRISQGKFVLHDTWYTDSFLLSGAAIFILTGLVLLLFSYRRTSDHGSG